MTTLGQARATLSASISGTPVAPCPDVRLSRRRVDRRPGHHNLETRPRVDRAGFPGSPRNGSLRGVSAREHDSPTVVVVTLDPWGDTPARLPSIAASWKLGDDGYVTSGPPERVVELLRRWNVAWARDDRTGEIVHAAVVYVVDRTGTLAYAATPDTRLIVELAGRL